MSFFPVAAAPAVPAPAPATAPMAAPLPPPASPPINAPRPAPPPISVAERLPLPFSLRATAEVSTGTFCPLTSIDVSLSCNNAPPFKRPSGCAVTTVTVALERSGITTAPPASTGRATVALKLSPAWLVLELSDCAVRTVITVPAGSVVGPGCEEARCLSDGSGAARDALEGCPAELGVDVAAGCPAGAGSLLVFCLLPQPAVSISRAAMRGRRSFLSGLGVTSFLLIETTNSRTRMRDAANSQQFYYKSRSGRLAGDFFKLLGVNVKIRVDVLNIIVILEGFQQPNHRVSCVSFEFYVVLRDHRNFGNRGVKP